MPPCLRPVEAWPYKRGIWLRPLHKDLKRVLGG